MFKDKLYRIFYIASFIVILPLILQTLLRPVGLWDYFTIFDVMGVTPEQVYDNSHFFLVLKQIFLNNTFVCRPINLMFHYLYAKIFEGNFWILLMLKWMAKFGLLWILYRFNQLIEGRKSTFLFVFSFLFFHTVCFEIMTFSPDGFAAFFCVEFTVMLYFKAKKYGTFDLIALTKKEYLSLCTVFLMAVGQKEICIALGVSTVMLYAFTAFNKKHCSVRILPFCFITLFFIIRNIQVAFVRKPGDTSYWGNTIRSLVRLIFETNIAYGILTTCVAVFFIIGVVLFCKKKKGHFDNEVLFAIYLSVTIGGMAGFSVLSTGQTLNARYVIPIVGLFGELLIFVNKEKGIIPGIAYCGVGIAIPFFCVSNIYAQHLAYAREFDEQMIELDYIMSEKECDPDLNIVISGFDEISEGRFAGVELQISVQRFFGYLGNRWYGIPNIDVMSLQEYEQLPCDSKRAIWFTSFDLEDASQYINDDHITGVSYGKPDNYTVNKIYEFFKKIDALLGLKSTITYDGGASELREGSSWKLYRIESYPANSNAIEPNGPAIEIDKMLFENYSTNQSVEKNLSERICVNHDECACLSYDLIESNGLDQPGYHLSGELTLTSGALLYGFSNGKGDDYKTKYITEPGIYKINLSYFTKEQMDSLCLIFYVNSQENTVFQISDLRVESDNIDKEILADTVNYGAFR